MTEILSNYPKELMENRNIIEGNFVMSLWSNPDLYDDFKINVREDLLTSEGRFYYVIGKKLYNQGFTLFDETTIYTLLSDNDALKDGFEKRGGYESVSEMINIVNSDNTEGYYEGLIKSNALINLYKKGFNVIADLGKLKEMSYDEVYDYYEYHLNDIFLNTSTGESIETLSIDKKFIDECNSGINMGFSYNKVCHILNYVTLGIPKGDLFMLASYSGKGKTSFTFANMVMQVVEDGHKTCIISNEQQIEVFKSLFLIYILTQKFQYFGVSRKKIKQGNFNTDQLEHINKAKKYVEDNYADNIKFVRMHEYSTAKVKKVVKKLAKQGFEMFLYDTMKGKDLGDKVWQNLIEDSKQLFQLVSKENVAFIVTYQLAIHTQKMRYLDASCLSNSKQIKEVFSEMLYFREIRDDEYTGDKNDIKPFNFIKNADGKYTKDKNYINITRDSGKKYMIIFVDKTRNGEDSQTILYEFDGAWNKWREIGYCVVNHEY